MVPRNCPGMTSDGAFRANLRSFCALLLLALVAACSLVAPHFDKPEVSVASIALVGGNFRQQNFLVKLNVRNPNDRALPVTSLHIEMAVAGEQVASGVSARSFVVPAHGDTQFDMNISANMGLALLKLAARKEQHAQTLEYDMTGGATIDLPLLREVPFHQTGALPLQGF